MKDHKLCKLEARKPG